ncbi:MAG TPA: hypothetical protein VHX65_09915 [Pirellulales bacterium]|nr:hypothetical protein [Pirellulales bacterium]
MLIEQAVFTSARTDRGRGYHLVATSPGIRPEDARQLTAWAPAHGSLCDAGAGGRSVNFHPLASGALCVSRSTAAGAEYSGRSGPRVYTQFFIVPADVLARFANNPLALLHSARVYGALKLYDPVPPILPAFDLPGRVAAVDEGLLAEFAERLGPRRIARLMDAALRADALVLVGARHSEGLLAGLLNCLPVECRSEVSFATGLAYSPRRPFRINVVEVDEAEQRRLARQPGTTLLNLADEAASDFVPTGWAAYLEQAIRSDRLTTLAAELHRTRAGLRLSDLAWLSDQLKARLHAGTPLPDPPAIYAEPPAPHITRLASAWGPAQPSREPDGSGPEASEFRGSDILRQPHAPHQQPARPRSSGLDPQAPKTSHTAAIAGPSTLLGITSVELLEKLERLDDLVFDTINGCRPALDELSQLWPQAIAELPRELWSESREQYLRYALALWESTTNAGTRDPQWAVTALDVLSLLFDAAM